MESGYWGGTRNYSRKDYLDVFLETRWWQRSSWNVVVAFMQGKNWHQCVTLTSDLWKNKLDFISQVSVFILLFVTLLTDAGLDLRLFSPASPSLKALSEWFHSVHGSWDIEAKIAHSHLIPAQPFPRPNTAGAPGKWERNITFPFRLRRMWHSVDGFCRIGSPEARLSFFF